MRTASWSTASLAVLVVASAGCSSAPSPIDLTPRFVAGESRTESLESYAAIRSRVADVVGNVGFSWQAKVASVGPEGATVDAQMTRVVCKLPGLPAFDSDGVIPVGITSVGELILKLVGVKFQYVVGPTGEVNVTGWQSALTEASKATNVPIPGDGSVPTEDMVEEALRRVYGIPMPRRQVVLEETWTTSSSYHLGSPEQGARVASSETFTYEGFGELRVPFGGRTEEVNGLGIKVKSTPSVQSAGDCYMGKIDVQTGRSGGFVCVGLQGDEILGYWEKSTYSVEPREGLMPGPVDVLGGALRVASKLVDFECGWVFFAGSPWR